MKFALPAHNLYGNAPVMLDIPDNWDVSVHEYAGVREPAMSDEAIRQAVAHPLGCAPISESARGRQDAIIIIDDISRPTPCGAIARAVISELEEAGIPRDRIRFMAAVGTHRAMSREEFVRKLGEDIVHEFRCYSHNPFFNCVSLGTTSQGVPIEINKEVAEADFKVALGTFSPHAQMGMGGGAKIIFPGVASLESVRRLHQTEEGRWILTRGGQQAILEAARAVHVDLKIDCMLNGKGEIARLFAGPIDRIAADHLDEAAAFYRTDFEPEADIVLANNYFKPSEPFVAIANTGLVFTVRKGGVLIVSSNSPQGAAPHYTFGKWGDGFVGGTSYHGPQPMARRLKTYYAFSVYPDTGTAITYHFNGETMKWADNWDKIVDDIGRGEPKKLVIYPYASVGYYSENGNIEKQR